MTRVAFPRGKARLLLALLTTVATAGAVGTTSATAAGAPGDVTVAAAGAGVADCDARPTTRVSGTLPGAYNVPRPPDVRTYDLRDLTAVGMPFATTEAIELGEKREQGAGSPRYMCVLGGTIQSSTQVKEFPRNYVKQKFQGHALHVEGAGGHPYVVDGLRVDLAEDGIGMLGDNFVVRNSWITNARDDCIENDFISAGRFEDSLFSCYMGLSTEPTAWIRQSLRRESLGPVVFDGVLMRLKPLPDPVTPDIPDGVTHNRIWKYAGTPPTPLRLKNSVLLIEERGIARTHPFPPDTQAENVTLVWLGSGPFPSPVPAGVTVTTDLSVWEQARADWLTRHGYAPVPDWASLDRTPATGSGSVELAWRVGMGATSYNVKRAVSPEGPFETIAEVDTTAGRTYTDTSVENGTRYYYRVSSVNAHGESPDSNVAVALPVADGAPAPTTPKNFVAVPDLEDFGQHGSENGRVSLSWNHVGGAEEYVIRRGEQPGQYTFTTVVRGNTLLDLGRPVGTKVYYQISARNRHGDSAPTAEATVDIPSPTDDVLPTPYFWPAQAGDGQISLAWKADPLSELTTYDIMRSTSPAGPFEVVGQSLTKVNYVDTNLQNGQTYHYKLRMHDHSGTSPVSEIVSETPQASPVVPEAVWTFGAERAGNGVKLTWQPSDLAAHYTVERTTLPDGPFEPVYRMIHGTSYTDNGVQSHQHYSYRITAVNSFGGSAAGDVETVRTGAVDHKVPTVTVSGVSDGAVYTLGDVPKPKHKATDGGGLDRHEGKLERPSTRTGAGAYTYLVTASDVATNESIVYTTYSVRYRFDFTGALALPGQTFAMDEPLVVRFRLRDAHGHGVGKAETSVLVDGLPAQEWGASPSQPKGTYQFRLDPRQLSQELHTLTIVLDDGTTHHTTFRLQG